MLPKYYERRQREVTATLLISDVGRGSKTIRVFVRSMNNNPRQYTVLLTGQRLGKNRRKEYDSALSNPFSITVNIDGEELVVYRRRNEQGKLGSTYYKDQRRRTNV